MSSSTNSNCVPAEAFLRIYRLLENVTSMAALDSDEQFEDCLEDFGAYEWEMADGQSAARFEELRGLLTAQDGTYGEMKSYLNEFLAMLSSESEVHPYQYLFDAERALQQYQELTN